MLKAEMEEHLGYAKYDYKNTSNSRNGKTTNGMYIFPNLVSNITDKING